MGDDRTAPAPVAEREALSTVAAAGVAVARTVRADSVDELIDRLDQLPGFPVVLKAGGLAHKTEHGGVVVGLRSPADLERAARRMTAELGGQAFPLVLQEQRAGVELMIGIKRDPSLGAVVVLGSGGVGAEVERDVAYALAPVGAAELAELPRRLRRWPLLAGYRGEAGIDLVALGAALRAMSDLAVARPDILELDVNPLLVGPAGSGVAVAVDALLVTAAAPQPRPRRFPLGAGIGRALDPRRVVVVGASADPRKAGSKIVARLGEANFRGAVEVVHPSGRDAQGRPCPTSVAAVAPGPDVVCVAIPSDGVAPVVADSVRVGAGAVTIMTAGFAEVGGVGADRQRELVAATAGSRTRICGPNLLGLVTPSTGAVMTFGSALEAAPLRTGTVALISSSGAIGGCIAARLSERGCGISRWLNTGNEADVDIADYLAFLADDELTAVVGIVVENLRDGPAFVEAAERVRRAGKLIFAHKAGTSDRGRRAAASHTGAIVGSDVVHDAIFRRVGVARAASLDAFEDALILAAQLGPTAAATRVAAITSSGGMCSIICDEADGCGLALPELTAATAQRLAALVPDFGSVRNPVDLTAQVLTDPTLFERALAVVRTSGEFDVVLVQLTTNTDPQAAQIARAIVEIGREPGVPVIVARLGAPGHAPEALAVYADGGMPVFGSPERAVRALAAVLAATGAPDPDPSARTRGADR